MVTTQAVAFDLSSRAIRETALVTFQVDSKNPNEIYWIHLNDLSGKNLHGIALSLGLPEDLVTELQNPESLPDVTEREDSLTLVVHYWESSPKGQPLDPSRLILHLTDRYCLTAAEESIPALERFSSVYRREFRFAETPGFVLFLILDQLVDDFTRSLRLLEQRSESIDDEIQNRFSEGLNQRILDLKREVITLKSFASSLSDTLMRISGRKIPVISENCRKSLADVYNHAHVLVNQLDSLRELVHNSLEAYNTVLALRMNRAMKVLTIFASIILPMSLIASIYGMNFEWMPELKWRYGYLLSLLLMGCGGALLLFLFKRKGLL
jgi:magnesium/cobalt transport protein CorA